MFCATPNTDLDSVKRQTAGSSCLPAMVEQCELRVLALQGTAYTPKHGKQKQKNKKKTRRKDREERERGKVSCLEKRRESCKCGS